MSFDAPGFTMIGPVERIFHDLRIESGHVWSTKRPGRIWLALRTREGGLLQSEHLQQAVDTEVKKPDNIRKLGMSGRVERHLFVYIDQGTFLPWISMLDNCIPEKPLVLPDEITHVWLRASRIVPVSCTCGELSRDQAG